MAGAPPGLVPFVQQRLAALADPEVAAPMAAYMKTDMPCYGVKKPLRVPIEREIKRRFAPADAASWEASVRALWALPHREEKYCALFVMRSFPRFLTPDALPLLEQLVREGAWWDLVDEIAARGVGTVWLKHRAVVTPLAERWIEDEDLWIRRTAIIGQLKHQDATDGELLFRFCRLRMHEREFFIRKAIGWALRAYSPVAPEAVADFLRAHEGELSGLSFREGSKWLVREGRCGF